MTIPIEPRTPRLYHAAGDAAFTPLGAIGVTCAAMASFLVVAGLVAGSGPLLVALLAGELMLLAIPVVAIVRTHRPIAALGLRRSPARPMLAALLIGSSAWYLNLRLVELLPLPEDGVHRLQQIVDQPPVIVALLVIALVPAVCEEVLFRGVLLRALGTRFVPAVAITLTALAFSAYHLSLLQLVPTFTLGLLLGLLAVRADSIVPAILAHLVNNTIAVLIAREELPGVASWIDEHATVALVIAALVAGTGIALAVRGPRAPTQRAT